MKKDIILDGLQKTTYMKDDMEGKIAVKEEVNIDSHLKHNKENNGIFRLTFLKILNLI